MILHRHIRPSLVTDEQFTRTRVTAFAGSPLQVRVVGNGRRLSDANVQLVLVSSASGGSDLPNVLSGITDDDGQFIFFYDQNKFNAVMLMAFPAGGFWSMVTLNPQPEVLFECPPLEIQGPLAWWHHAVGINDYSCVRGEGINIGVIDSGIGPNPPRIACPRQRIHRWRPSRSKRWPSYRQTRNYDLRHSCRTTGLGRSNCRDSSRREGHFPAPSFHLAAMPTKVISLRLST